MRRPDDSDDTLSLSTSFDRRPQPTRTLVLADPILSTDTAVVAEDGVRLALKRYTPRRQHSTTPRKPVILCHGLSGNSTPFDLHRHSSLAWALALQGHPVWLVNLRGAGESDRPASGWTLDDHIRKDVPTVIHHVWRAHYGDGRGGQQQQRVHWVGHSMGGMIILCALATDPSLQPYVQTVSTIASALDYEESAWGRFSPLVPIVRLLPSHDKLVLPESLTPALLSILSIYPYFLCAEKISKEALAELDQSLEPVSLGVMQHLATAIQPGGLAVQAPTTLPAPTTHKATTLDPPGAPGTDDTLPPPPLHPPPQRYLQLMGRVRTPVLGICGDRDVQCRESAVLRMLAALGSARRRFVLAGGGGEEGTPTYGHMDLLLKESAVRDVFPYVCEWIATAEAAGWGPGEFQSEEEGEGAATEGLLEEEEEEEVVVVANTEPMDGRGLLAEDK